MNFSQDIKKFVNKNKLKIKDNRDEIVFRLFRAIIMDTPVDTGRLRANWQCTSSVPASSTTESISVNLNSIFSNIKNSDTKQPIFLTNNLPYVYAIEYLGHSKKAPAGMVRKNVSRFNRIAKEVAG